MGIVSAFRRKLRPELRLSAQWEDFKTYKRPRIKAKTLAKMDQGWKRHLEKHFGHLLPEEVTPDMVQRHHTALALTPAVANRTYQRCLGGLYNWMKRQGRYSGPNPVEALEPLPERKKRNTASAAQLARIHGALDQAERDPDRRLTALCIRFLMFTGLRVGEALKLEWEQIQDGYLAVEGKNGLQMRFLCRAAAAVLDRTPRTDVSVYPLRYHAAYRAWKVIAEDADCSGLVLHDLRRTWSSRLGDAGVSLSDVAALANQTEIVNARVYRHLSPDRLRELAELGGERMEGIQ